MNSEFTGIRGNFIMLKFQFFATGIDMISNEVQTSQLYAAFYIFCRRFCHQVLLLVLFVFSKLLYYSTVIV